MAKIRVLVVDGAVLFRRTVSDALSRDPGIEVVGAAANGKIALHKIPQVHPDVITMDVEMPDGGGVKALEEIRKAHPALPVILFTSLTEAGGHELFDALALGAKDYVTKPPGGRGMDPAFKRVEEELVPKIRALCPRNVAPASFQAARRIRAERESQPAARRLQLDDADRPARSSGPRKVGIVAIGVSTGGPNALAAIFAGLPKDLGVPIAIVQHMPPLFTKLLAERLTAVSQVAVHEAAAGDVLRPGEAWLAPGDHHMTVARLGDRIRVETNRGPPENSCRPSVDVLFRSVARTCGAQTLAIVLTGMGQDGLHGCEEIREADGQIIAQDEASSIVWGMAGHVVRAGLADRVVPLPQIAETIVRTIRAGA